MWYYAPEKMKYTPHHATQALQIMEELSGYVTPRAEYSELMAILRDPARWKEAHAQFSKIRSNITLPSEKLRSKGPDSYFAYIAENAAKTAYNCSGESAPFDDDSFEWLLRCKREFMEALESK
jgi:hypothetical protein